jgi:signal transduction histidine kinase
MRAPAVADLAAELVTGALDAGDASQAYAALLDPLRRGWRADRAVLVNARDGGAAALVHQVPASAGDGVDPGLLATAFAAEGPVSLGPVPEHGLVLAVGLRPRDDHRWSVGLVRAPGTWTAAERAALGDLRPHLELVVEHAALHVALAAARAREKDAASEHERFLSAVSHELRNPLAPILMWTSTLKRLRGDDPEVQRATTAIAHAVNLERRLLEELLDLSRLERGTIDVVMERVDLRDVVGRAIDLHRRAAADAQLALEADIPPDPVLVRADAGRLAQVVGALLDNAVKFTPAKGRVGVVVARRGAQAEVSVRDSGTGFPADVLSRLFAPFVQGTNARGGLGLGLNVSQRLVTLQHGTIDAGNAADGGAAVVVALPLATA